MNPNDKVIIASVDFRCRRCGATYHIGCAPHATAMEFITLMARMKAQACRYCGAQGDHNYVLYNATVEGSAQP